MLSLIELTGGGCYSPEMEAGSREAAAAIEMLVERVDETDWNFKWGGWGEGGWNGMEWHGWVQRLNVQTRE